MAHRASLEHAEGGGFTLLELIVVITIIGILGTLVVVRVTPVSGTARRTKIDHDLKKVTGVAQMIHVSRAGYPETLEDMLHPRDAAGNELVGLEAIPLDPWNHPYQYALVDGRPVVTCLGRDHQEGGTGEDADVRWPPE